MKPLSVAVSICSPSREAERELIDPKIEVFRRAWQKF
jgi:hypothetical protein